MVVGIALGGREGNFFLLDQIREYGMGFHWRLLLVTITPLL